MRDILGNIWNSIIRPRTAAKFAWSVLFWAIAIPLAGTLLPIFATLYCLYGILISPFVALFGKK